MAICVSIRQTCRANWRFSGPFQGVGADHTGGVWWSKGFDGSYVSGSHSFGATPQMYLPCSRHRTPTCPDLELPSSPTHGARYQSFWPRLSISSFIPGCATPFKPCREAPVKLTSCVCVVIVNGFSCESNPRTITGKEIAMRCSLRRPIKPPDILRLNEPPDSER